MFGERPGVIASTGLLLLRLGAGGMMLFGHGIDKLQKFGEYAKAFPDPIGLGSYASFVLILFAEVVCAALVMLGVATRLASIPLVIGMLVAAFVVHAPDAFAQKEMALLYALAFLTLVFTGPGIWSADRFITRGRHPQ